MSTPIINGTSGAYQQPDEIGQDSTGPYRVLRFEGTRAAIQAKIQSFGIVPPQYILRKSFSGAKDQLEVRFAGGAVDGVEVPSIVWELRVSAVEKDIARSAAASALSLKDREILRAYISNPSSDIGAFLNVTDLGAQFYEIVKAGETSVRQFVPFLSRTITMATPLAGFIATQNIGKIFKTASLFGGEGLLPTDFVFPLPNDADPIPTADDPRRLHYGWMKCGLTGTRTAYQKTAITQEYEYGLWPEAVYGLPL